MMWIKCSERMPESECLVIVYCIKKKQKLLDVLPQRVNSGYFYAGLNQWLIGGSRWKVSRNEVTHWQPLPTPPEEDDAEEN